MTEELKLCPLTWAIQRINSTPYSLTKDECVEVLRGLRDEIRTLTAAQPAQAGDPTHPADCRCTWCKGKPAAQATPEPVGEPVAWRYKIPTHGGGTAWTHTRPQPECLIEAQPLYTHPAPVVPDGEPKLTQEELLEVAKHAWLMARTADSLQFYRTLLAAAAQAKGGEHG